MKKIFIFLLTAVSVMLMFTSCGGFSDSASIHAQDYILQQSCNINLSVKNAAVGTGYFTQFAIEKDLAALAESIRDQNISLDTYIYQDKYILIQNSDQKAPYFLIAEIEKQPIDKESETRYIFFASIGRFRDESQEGKDRRVYMPYHLLKGISAQHYPSSEGAYANGLTCEALRSIDDFYDFYANQDIYTVNKIGDVTLEITDKTTKDKIHLNFSQVSEKSNVTFNLS